ncbi:MAG: hypothetical protein Q4G43_04135 [Mobilicoccus sp.]|nr:hypothetical protein [Mobilicoccus sp.]
MSGEEPARTELRRLARRWQQLPAGQALAASGALRDLAADLLDVDASELPDLGPATALDQVRVAVYEHLRDHPDAEVDLAERLAGLRGSLTPPTHP